MNHALECYRVNHDRNNYLMRRKCILGEYDNLVKENPWLIKEEEKKYIYIKTEIIMDIALELKKSVEEEDYSSAHAYLELLIFDAKKLSDKIFEFMLGRYYER